MKLRGYNHRSPLPKFSYRPERYILGVAYTREEMLADLNLLIKRKGVIKERVKDMLDLIWCFPALKGLTVPHFWKRNCVR